MHPDDDNFDRIDVYEPKKDTGARRRMSDYDAPPKQHCETHEVNTNLISTVNQKLNWCLSGLATLIACMAYLLVVQIAQGKESSTMMQQMIQNTADIRALQLTAAKTDEEINSLFRWRERWETKESFSHEVKGVENHHVEKPK
jgi:hypothetical protein